MPIGATCPDDSNAHVSFYTAHVDGSSFFTHEEGWKWKFKLDFDAGEMVYVMALHQKDG